MIIAKIETFPLGIFFSNQKPTLRSQRGDKGRTVADLLLVT